MNKLISIIIPIYNAEKYIDECISSIINEINEKMEIILIDDGSTDRTREIYSKYKNIDNLKIIRQENHGVSYTRNRGINEANGKYIMFVDIDDYLKKGWSQVILNNIQEDNEYIIFSKRIENIYEKDELLKGCLGLENNKLNKCHIMSPCSKLFRTDFIRKENIKFKENIINGEDMLFNFEVILKSKNIKCINESFYIYRKNMQSSTNCFNEKVIESELNFHKELHKMIENELDDSWNEYEKNITLNGIYVCFLKYSLSKGQDTITLINLVEKNKDYSEVIQSCKNSKNRKIFYYFISTRKYKLALLYLKIRNQIKRIFYILHKQNIIEEI